jgi:type VI secretion system protein ImpJ
MVDGPVYWHQGLFLQPQHFQILEGRTAQALAPVMENVTPFFWGLAAGELNEAALAAGRLEIKHIRLVFPSLPETIAYPGNAVCAARQVPVESIPVDGAMTVYVGLRAAKAGEVNVTVAETAAQLADAPTRLAVRVAPEPVPNAYGDGPPAQVRRLVHVLKLVFESELEQSGELDLIPVGRLVRNGAAVTLDPAFVPPLLTLSASPLLSSMLKAVRDRVLGKARQLESFKNLSARGPASGDFTLLLMGLRTLSRFAARLDHATGAPCLSPWQAYGMLRELVAELSVFSLNISVLGENWNDEKLVPDYAHSRLGVCFGAIHDLIVRLLEGISAGPRFVTRFEFQEPYWTAQIPAPVLAETQASGGEYWLVLHSRTLSPEALRDSAARMLKVSAPGGMESLLVRALPGIPLTASEYAPQGMPRMQGAIYFHLDRESPQWQEVEKAGCISLHWTGAPDDLAAELAVLAR